VWELRSDPAYYVDKYNVALPEEFIEHARENGWSIRQDSSATAAAEGRSGGACRG
jgi:hypothetical protein